MADFSIYRIEGLAVLTWEASSKRGLFYFYNCRHTIDILYD